MTDFFDEATVTFHCPNCGSEMAKTVGWLRNNVEIACPSCGTKLELDRQKFEGPIQDLDRAIDEFKHHLKQQATR